MKPARSHRKFRRGNPFLRERVHDPYRAGEKLNERTFCPECGVQYRHGRWVWPERDAPGLKRQLCPACRRINDDYPAGAVIITGDFAVAHRDEILAVVHRTESVETLEHPLNRIIAIDEDNGELLVTTTDIHLPHRIAHALRDAFGGSMSTQYDMEGCFARARWQRDD